MNRTMTWLTCGCALALMAGCAKGPSAAYQEMAAKADKKDWSGVYDSFSAKAQGQMDMSIKMLVEMGAAFAEDEEADEMKKMKKLEGKELFAAVMSSGDESETPFPLGEVTKEDVAGDKATLTIKTKDGKEIALDMVKENKQWKLVPDMD